MRKVARQLTLWAGAAAIAGGGFAYMAANEMTSTSLGAGTGSVTGYTVTTVTWHSAPVTTATDHTYRVTGVTMVLTSKATATPATLMPTSVEVALVLSTGTHLAISTGTHGSCRFGTTGQAWSVDGSGQGTGKLSCSVSIQASGEPPTTDVTGIAVEAST